MAQIIHLNTPTQADVIGQFADSYTQRQRQRQLMDAENRRIGIEQQRADTEGEVSRGTLGLAKSSADQKQRDAYFANFIKTAVDPYMDGTPEGQAIAKKNVEAELARDPNAAADLRAYAIRLSEQPTMADRTKANVGKFAETQSGIAAGGGTDPNAVNFATHSAIGAFMPNEGFQQQQAADLQARGGGSMAAIPKPTGNAVTDYERRATQAMTTAPENQVAQTQITTEGMRQTGETKRTGMQIDANKANAAVLFGGVQPTGADGAASASPVVKALVDRSFDPMLMRRWKPEQVAAVVAAAQAIDPQFNMADYNAQYKAKQQYTSGPQAQNITAINTAIRHLKSLDEDLKALDNSGLPAWNTAANWVSRQAGNAKVQKAMASVEKDADAVANELNKAFRGSSQMTEKETASWRQGLGTSTTPAEARGAIESAAKLLAGRVAEMENGYRRGVGRPSDIDFLGKGGRKIIKAMGLDGVFAADAAAGASNAADPLGLFK